MRKRRWLQKVYTRTEVIDPVNRRLLSRARVEYKREVKSLKRSEYNARRRERRARHACSKEWQPLTPRPGQAQQERIDAYGEVVGLTLRPCQWACCLDRFGTTVDESLNGRMENRRERHEVIPVEGCGRASSAYNVSQGDAFEAPRGRNKESSSSFASEMSEALSSSHVSTCGSVTTQSERHIDENHRILLELR